MIQLPVVTHGIVQLSIFFTVFPAPGTAVLRPRTLSLALLLLLFTWRQLSSSVPPLSYKPLYNQGGFKDNIYIIQKIKKAG